MSTLQPTSDRITAIDALRGFALAGIVLVHMVEQYVASFPPEQWRPAMVRRPIDSVIDASDDPRFLLFKAV